MMIPELYNSDDLSCFDYKEDEMSALFFVENTPAVEAAADQFEYCEQSFYEEFCRGLYSFDE